MTDIEELGRRVAEAGWLIERGDSSPAEPWYWAAGQRDAERSSAWTQNHMQAIRFARKEDAEKVHRRLFKGIDVRIAEHQWPPLSALRSTKDEGAEEDGDACERCQGNGEIVTDWDRYRHPAPGDVGDEAVAACPDCGGTGRVNAEPQP